MSERDDLKAFEDLQRMFTASVARSAQDHVEAASLTSSACARVASQAMVRALVLNAASCSMTFAAMHSKARELSDEQIARGLFRHLEPITIAVIALLESKVSEVTRELVTAATTGAQPS